jgi:hypothetical protein
LTTSQTFVLGAATAVVVGNDLGGLTRVFRTTPAGVDEVPTKVPHQNGRASISPLGSLLVVGGAGEVESFTP